MLLCICLFVEIGVVKMHLWIWSYGNSICLLFNAQLGTQWSMEKEFETFLIYDSFVDGMFVNKF